MRIPVPVQLLWSRPYAQNFTNVTSVSHLNKPGGRDHHLCFIDAEAEAQHLAPEQSYARILAFLQSKARLGAEPAFQPLGSHPEPDFSYQLHPAAPEFAGHSPGEASVFPQGAAPGPFSWPHGAARSPALPYLPSAPVPLPSPAQQHSPFLAPVQGLDRHYLNLIGHAHPNALNLHAPQHPPVL
nr:PREDICTED: hairy and enhancer of split-related protein HELT [Equus przewalskii]